MNDSDTSHIRRDSVLGRLGLSVRGIVVTMMVLTICIAVPLKIDITEPLYSLSIAAVSYYFGQQQQHGHTKP